MKQEPPPKDPRAKTVTRNEAQAQCSSCLAQTEPVTPVAWGHLVQENKLAFCPGRPPGFCLPVSGEETGLKERLCADTTQRAKADFLWELSCIFLTPMPSANATKKSAY